MTPMPNAERFEATLSLTVDELGRKSQPPAQSIGVDVVEISRLARLLEKTGGRLQRRLFTSAEQRFCDGDIDRLASTLAAKEAVSKALGTGIRGGIRWTDIEILRTRTGVPYTRLHAAAAERASELRIRDVAVSLGHEGSLAFAAAIGLSEELAP
jgi:holo-[acyl-carrier protein] synthase